MNLRKKIFFCLQFKFSLLNLFDGYTEVLIKKFWKYFFSIYQLSPVLLLFDISKRIN